MNEDRHSFYLGMTIIAAIVTIYGIGALRGQAADIAVLTGLIGVLGTFTRKGSTVDQATLKDAVAKIPPETTTDTQEAP